MMWSNRMHTSCTEYCTVFRKALQIFPPHTRSLWIQIWMLWEDVSRSYRPMRLGLADKYIHFV